MKHCKMECHGIISKCPIKRALEQYNKKYPDREIRWCARCDGEFYGWRIVRQNGKVVKLAQYNGGLIEAGGKISKISKYDFMWACDCDCGKEQQKTRIVPYQFGDTNDRSICYQKRKTNNILRKKQRRQRVRKETKILPTSFENLTKKFCNKQKE